MTKSNKEFYSMTGDGVTQSLLSMFLTCRQLARLYLQGWKSKYHREGLTYGAIGHKALELAYLDLQVGSLKAPPTVKESRKYASIIEKTWREENPRADAISRGMMEEALAVTEYMLPLYFDYWRDDFKKKKWISLEQQFEMPMTINTQDGKVVIPLRGKKDGTFEASKGVWLFETKFKSMVNEGDLMETLSFETQVMLYLLQTWKQDNAVPKGVLYNIVRRGLMKRRVKEDVVQYAKRVGKDMETRPDHYFIRIESPNEKKDLVVFKGELEGLLSDMYNWWKGYVPHYKNTYQCVSKFGKCQFLAVCSRGDFNSVVKRAKVFEELGEY